MTWTKNPVIYEINTWAWLSELSRKHERAIQLGNVPPGEWDDIASLKMDAVWLMGVWERSPEGIKAAMKDEDLQAEFRRTLPDFRPEDVVGSPYCIRRYVVDEHLGGPKGLRKARKSLETRGIRLILDFVPNHVALDHPWVLEHPEYFVRGDPDDLRRSPAEFVEIGDKIFAHGRDPYFQPWPDVVQLNAFHSGLRQAALEAVSTISGQCDGMRCDMAMLLMNKIFEKTWRDRAGDRPGTEYWEELIQNVRKKYRDILFIAEAYWDTEQELQQQGFDYCYDKRLYDRLVHDGAETLRRCLTADAAYQRKLIRFIENHDEPRAASAFPVAKEKAAAVAVSTLPGARLFHEGQLEGRKIKLPIFLGRRPEETPHPDLQPFYRKLLKVIHRLVFREGDWTLCQGSGWPDNQSHVNLAAWSWKKKGEKYLIVVNLSDQRSQGRVLLPWDELTGRSWRLTDLFKEEIYDRDGNEMTDPGLYVELEAWGFHFLKF